MSVECVRVAAITLIDVIGKVIRAARQYASH